MTFANSSESEVAFVEEATYGVTPATPAWQYFRFTGETLTHTFENGESEEITPTSDLADEVQLAANASGDLNFELSFGDKIPL